jgi:hypothetical protein
MFRGERWKWGDFVEKRGENGLVGLPYRRFSQTWGWDPGQARLWEAADAVEGQVDAGRDVNKDTYSDLVIGANLANSQAGYTYVVFGSGTSMKDGRTVAVGDVTGDTYPDIITSVPSASPCEGSDAGEVYVYFGKASGWPNPNLSRGGLWGQGGRASPSLPLTYFP